MNSREDKLKYFEDLKQETQIHEILEEILPELGFEDVKLTHEKGNKPEYGKDLVCSKFDDLEGKKDWLAFVVKKGVISGKSGVVKEIADQVYECFEYPYKSVEQKSPLPISKVKVVTNRHFSSGAKEKIFENNKLDRANIDFWDAGRLIDFIDKKYPQFWFKGSKNYKKYAERLEQRIQVDNVAKSLGINSKKAERLVEITLSPKLFETSQDEEGNLKKKRIDVTSVISIPDNSIIIGQPGSGKSTIFKKLCKEVLLQNTFRNEYEFYPVILSFSKINQADFDIKEALRNYFNEIWLQDIKIDLDKILTNSQCVIFIDALDEVSKTTLKEKALLAVKNFHELYPNIKIICSSRPSDFIEDLSQSYGFKQLEVDDLNKTQVSDFLKQFFKEDLIKSRQLLKSLQDSGILDKLPKTPLTLSLITIIFDENEVEIPATISDLYQNFVDLLIGKYTPENTIQIIEVGIKQRLLCTLAKKLHLENNVSIKKADAVKLFEDYAKERGHKFDAVDVLEDLLENTGLLFKNDKNEIQFKHLSFQEYFTAYEYFHHRPSEREIFIKNFNKVWWQNVALFYAGMSKDAPKLIEEILESSVPQNFTEMLTNTAGIGKMLQALYNTPVDMRIKGLERTLDNTLKALDFLIETEDPKYKFFKHFSKYGLMQLIGNWFIMNHHSISLHEPINQVFDKNIKEISSHSSSSNELFELEFSLHLIATILASPEYLNFSKSRQLIENHKSIDLSLLAMMDTDFRESYKRLNKDEKRHEDVAKIRQKLEGIFRKIGKISDKVNIKLIEKDIKKE